MPGLSTCILHSNVAEVVQRLDEMLVVDEETGETRGVLLLLGLPKTGKDRVLQYWMRREHENDDQWQQMGLPVMATGMELPPIIKADVWKPEGTTLGRNVYATPMTCRTFSEVAYELGKESSQFIPTYAKRWYREPKVLHSDSQFDSLFSFVRTEVQRLRVRAVVINNAHLLDGCTLEMLMLLRKHCRNQLSIVLSAQMIEKANLDEPLAEAFRRASEAADQCTKVELQRLTRREFKQVVLPQLTAALNLDFDDDLLEAEIAKQVPNALWEYTKGDWKQIDNLAQDIKRAVPEPGNGRPRKVSRKVLEYIVGKSFDV